MRFAHLANRRTRNVASSRPARRAPLRPAWRARATFGPVEQIELAVLLGGSYIDSCRAQLPNVFVTALRINDVNRPLAQLEAIFYEVQQHTVLVVVTIEKSAGVAVGAEDCSPDSNRLVGFPRIVSRMRRMLQMPAPNGHFRKLDSNP